MVYAHHRVGLRIPQSSLHLGSRARLASRLSNRDGLVHRSAVVGAAGGSTRRRSAVAGLDAEGGRVAPGGSGPASGARRSADGRYALLYQHDGNQVPKTPAQPSGVSMSCSGNLSSTCRRFAQEATCPGGACQPSFWQF